MNGARLLNRKQIAAGAVVAALVTAGLMTTADATGTQGAQPLLASGVRFRIVGEAVATSNPAVFTNTSFVVPNHVAVDLTDVVVQNPHGDNAMLRVLIGTEVILEENLAGLRDQQYAIPLHVNADQPVVVAVNCRLPGPPAQPTGKCAPAVGFFG